MPKTEIAYVPELETLLKQQGEQAESYSILHNLAYEKYQFRSNIINIPVIVLSSVIGLLTGMNIQNDDMFIILSTGSIFVSVIKSIDSYFQLQKRAEGHRICSLQFSQIFKKIQIELSLHKDMRSNPKDMLALIKTDLKNLFDIAPLLDEDIIMKYKGKYKTEEANKNGPSIPSVCNGLTSIEIAKDHDPYKTHRLPMYYDPDINNPALNPVKDEGVIMSIKPIGSNEWENIKLESVDVVDVPNGEGGVSV